MLEIPSVILITPDVFNDERGFFSESYKESDFFKNGITDHFVQNNYSYSQKYVLRGLHFQKTPHEQSKLIRVFKGEILDVAVDLRKYSPTFSKYISVKLSDQNNQMLFIPKGFAHGFLSLSNEVIMSYQCSEEYAPKHDSGIRWDDPTLNIDWELPEKIEPKLSVKDKQLPLLKEIYQ